MAKKDDSGVGILINILFFGFIAIVWIVKELIKLIVAICVGISNLVRKNNIKKETKNIVSNSTKNTRININTRITKNKIRETLQLFDMSIYDDLFEKNIKERGLHYYHSGNIKEIKNTELKYTALVQGTYPYNVSIEFDNEDNNKIISVDCECKYFKDKQHYCKHIYAVLYKIKAEINRLKLTEEITKFSNDMNDVIVKITEKISHIEIVDYKEQQSILNKIEYTVNRLQEYVGLINGNTTEEKLLDILYEMSINMSDLVKSLEKMLVKEEDLKIAYNSQYVKKEPSTLSSILMGFVIADGLDHLFNCDKN